MTTLESPCKKSNCVMIGQNKNNNVCRYCKARADYSLALQGDTDALKRYTEFKYPNIGSSVIKEEQVTPRTTKDYYNEKLLRDTVRKIRAKFKVDTQFDDLGDVLRFLYEKYKTKTRVALFLGQSTGTATYIFRAFNL